ncbi:MAG: 16S rRNA (cytosine(967)-C(5))-methyltransferase RsmB [Clostridia bacterium]|nr:16S rRNA (cytosine(967)-C(5))-methyltransferase RsmB [Clostridia bacterium]
MIDKAREIALKALYKIDKEDAYSNIALDEQLKQNAKKINDKDIGLISQIVYGVTTWKLTLDAIIDKYSKIKLKKISPWIINILRMGIYQIIFLDKIPKSAAVDESVNLAKRYGHKTSSGFVNAILRKVEEKDYQELFEIKDDIQKLSKTQSMPIWLVEKLIEENGIEKAELICKNLNLKPEISIRINKLKTTKQDIKDELDKKQIKTKDGKLEDFLIIQNIKNIENLEEFKRGLFTVQDESAGLAALTLKPDKGEKVLDACSAPGGKTTYLAELMENDGTIDAWDIYEHRLKLIQENCQRLGVKIVNTKIQNAEQPSKSKEEYDKILLDVPCLGIGVIKRKPDIKWHRKKEDVEKISKIQLNILENCSKLLKVGGELVYSTCSILKEENEYVITNFLNNNKNFEIMDENAILPSEEQDGFYICKLKKYK